MTEVWVQWPGSEVKVKMVSYLDIPIKPAVALMGNVAVLYTVLVSALGTESDKLGELNVRETMELAESWIDASRKAEGAGGGLGGA